MNKFKTVLKDRVEKTIVTNRVFGYQKGGLTLNFTIPVTKKSFTDYRECLESAIQDINNGLQEINE